MLEEYPDPTTAATLNMVDKIKDLPSLQDQVVELIEKKINKYYGAIMFHKAEALEELLSEIKLLNN
jgi:hypothetical protein